MGEGCCYQLRLGAIIYAMPRPKPADPLEQVLIRLPASFLAEVDKHRGEMSRPQWIAGLVKAYVVDRMPDLPQAEVGRVMRDLNAQQRRSQISLASVQLGPTKREFGENLKKPKR